jgi:hypothetical protein
MIRTMPATPIVQYPDDAMTEKNKTKIGLYGIYIVTVEIEMFNVFNNNNNKHKIYKWMKDEIHL